MHRSRALLEKTLVDLAREHEFASVSVSAVTARAGMSRSTFYDHYTDIGELAESACASLFDELAGRMPALGRYALDLAVPPDDTLRMLFEHLAENRRLYTGLLGPNGSIRLQSRLLEKLTIASYVSRNLGEGSDSRATHGGDPVRTPHDPVAAFLAGGSLGIAIDWLQRGCPVPVEEMARKTWAMLVAVGTIDVQHSGRPPVMAIQPPWPAPRWQ